MTCSAMKAFSRCWTRWDSSEYSNSIAGLLRVCAHPRRPAPPCPPRQVAAAALPPGPALPTPRVVRRFYKEAAAIPAGGGHGVALDGKPVRTPAREPLVVPSRALADAIAAEWHAQEGEVRP